MTVCGHGLACNIIGNTRGEHTGTYIHTQEGHTGTYIHTQEGHKGTYVHTQEGHTATYIHTHKKGIQVHTYTHKKGIQVHTYTHTRRVHTVSTYIHYKTCLHTLDRCPLGGGGVYKEFHITLYTYHKALYITISGLLKQAKL